MCLYVAMYLSMMGAKGLKEVNETSFAGAHYLHDKLLETGKFEKVYDQPFLNEFIVRYNGDLQALQGKMIKAGILPGVPVGEDKLLVAVTEKRSKEELDTFIQLAL